ncbi:class A beta-lactamase [Tsuneonella sp. YG55]|uniref:beta-lactamase n=1 Tax=Tsuneonella litorea TaxID=2976475 RepID=A0A9X3AN57_9SPHN|nr:class A beta-lactamase [Tsuneonella litorea]MCT2559262.1 class A beta-lactamase [Tsuneonella litorea]
MILDRRALVAGTGALGLGACVPLDTSTSGRLAAKLRLIEAGLGGALGVMVLDPAQNASLGHRQDERFAMASSFKTTLAALVLWLDQQGRLAIDETVRWSEADLLSYAPFARERLATGASLRDLARAAQTASDNTAANLLLARVGGPEAVTAFWRALGDGTSRLERIEPQLNFVPDGTLADTTTPAAMARTIHRLVADGPLDPARRAILRQWMRETTTGLQKVRAGVPDAWEAGDKTGNSGDWPGMGHTRADIGYVVAPTGDIASFAVYHRSWQGSAVAADGVDAAFAEIGRMLTAWLRALYTITPA